jgi:hypothetical protein
MMRLGVQLLGPQTRRVRHLSLRRSLGPQRGLDGRVHVEEVLRVVAQLRLGKPVIKIT